ncbi:MAG: DUF4038 domain-containing protein [Isosphaeraceae bacterium]
MLLIPAVAFLLVAPADESPCPMPAKVSPDGHFLLDQSGKPYFYLADTAWELFHRLDRDQAVKYLETRRRQGFTAIQAVAIAEVDGHSAANPYGHLPLVDLDPARPAVMDGPANDYWDHVDFIVEEANRRGLAIGFLPTWGRYWRDPVRDGKPIFTPENADAYGEWLGRRYEDKAIVWILGGDRPVENDTHRAIIRAMARGLRKGDGGRHLITFHPPGANGSSTWFHDEDWLDFNMRQNGHANEFSGRYSKTRDDHDRRPARPVIDGEPIYEDHPVSFDAKKHGHSIAADVRRALYWDLFGGACGHTYGHHSVWQMWQPDRAPINNPLMPWTEAIEQPGANQMIHGRRLIESRPILSRIPDDSVIVADRVATSVPGAGIYRFAATRDRDGSYAMVYAHRSDVYGPHGVIAGRPWPPGGSTPGPARRRSASSPARAADNSRRPTRARRSDWVLVLDDKAKGYPPPGRSRPALEGPGHTRPRAGPYHGGRVDGTRPRRGSPCVSDASAPGFCCP